MPRFRPTAVEFFSGVGGMSLGFEQAGWDVLAAFDIEARNVETYNKNFAGFHAHQADLETAMKDSLCSSAGISGRKIDLVFGGPPCQGFSTGGKRDPKDPRNRLISAFARLVREFRPRYFVMENVEGLTHPHAKPTLDSFLEEMKASGYQVVEPVQVLNAADFGVPQRRRRVFVLGCLKGEVLPVYPKPTKRRRTASIPTASVRDAIGDLPSVELYDDLLTNDTYTGPLQTTESRYARLLRGEVRDKNDKSQKRQSAGLSGCLRTNHTTEIISRFASTAPGCTEPVSRYIRLAWDEVAPTIRAGTNRDHGSHTAPRPIHPAMPRCITTREAARLHSFPDWFVFHETKWHGFRQIGNSVPPLLARAVAARVLQAAMVRERLKR